MSNIKLSDAEIVLAGNADILLTKNRIIQAVYELFGNLSAFYTAEIQKYFLPMEVLNHASPKIYRGENYRGLPWVMLDYPRYFSRNDIFSIRTMFWWGNHFSQFLLLKGKFLPSINDQLISCMQYQRKWFINTNKDPFQHYFEPNNMVPIAGLTGQNIHDHIVNSGLLKLGTKIPINAWNTIEAFMKYHFQCSLQIASTQ